VSDNFDPEPQSAVSAPVKSTLDLTAKKRPSKADLSDFVNSLEMTTIYVLCENEAQDLSRSFIAKRLAYTQAIANEAIDRLIDMGLASETATGVKIIQNVGFFKPEDFGQQDLLLTFLRHSKSTRRMLKTTDRYFGAVLKISPSVMQKNMPLIEKLLIEMEKESLAEQASPGKNELYFIDLSLAQITRSMEDLA